MWTMLAVAILIQCVLLFLPGVLILEPGRLCLSSRLALAPLITVGIENLAFALYGIWDIPCSPLTVWLPFCLVSISVYTFSRLRFYRLQKTQNTTTRFSQRQTLAKHTLICVILYVAAGILLTSSVFLLQLPTADAFIQSFDEVHHLDAIRGFAESGRFSSLHTSLYLGQDEALNPYVSNAFYPSAWHAQAAFLVQIMNVSPALAANATTCTCLIALLPLGTYSLLTRIFGTYSRVVIGGVVVALANASNPWMLTTWGPLLPNLMAQCLLPSFMGLCIAFLHPAHLRYRQLAKAGVLAVGISALAFTQPNAVFSAYVLLLPYLLYRIHTTAKKRLPNTPATALGISVQCVWIIDACAVAAALIIWLAAYSAPFMQAVVSYEWPPVATIPQALTWVLDQSYYTRGLHIAATLLLVLGIARSMRKQQHRWLVVSFALACVIFIVSVTCSGSIQHILAGFWYCDCPRIAAFCALAAVPLEALGIEAVFLWLQQHLQSRSLKRTKRSKTVAPITHAPATTPSPARAPAPTPTSVTAHAPAQASRITLYASFITAVLCTVGLYAPLAGIITSADEGHLHDTGNALYTQSAVIAEEYRNVGGPVYTAEEQAFVDEVLALIPKDAVIINEPCDGSAYSFGYQGLRTLYRSWTYEQHDNAYSTAIRMNLNKVAEDVSFQATDVRKALRHFGAAYVLRLDTNPLQATLMQEFHDKSLARDTEWLGIQAVYDTTPGFEVMLSRGDMRLYKINADLLE